MRNELQKLRLERLNAAVSIHARRCGANNLHLANKVRVHPEFLEIGRLIYESSTRDFKPSEIPEALRSCPWNFVIAEMQREFPDRTARAHSDWTLGGAMSYFVECYLRALQSGIDQKSESKPRQLFGGM